MFEQSKEHWRNNKPTALMLMREFYHDYSNRSKQKTHIGANFEVHKKTNSSVQKFSTFLRKMGNM